MSKIFSIPYWAFLALLVYMPFHIFFSQWLSTFTGGLDVWKIWKDLLLFFVVLISLVLVYAKNGFKDKFYWLIALLSVLYVALHFFIWVINPDIDKGPALLGTVYNCRPFGYLIVGFSAALLLKNKLQLSKIYKIVIIISTVVCLIALLQWFLPKDIMTHFGYSIERGVKPNFFIDDKPDLPRVFSTIRDPLSLGAFLILPATILAGAWPKLKNARILISGLLLLHGLVIFLTFSRSTWLGAALSVGLILIWQYKNQTKQFLKKFWPFLLIGLCLILAGTYLARDNYVVQNLVFHADENTKEDDPNEKRVNFYEARTDSVLNRPIGHGPGTAGLVSIQTKEVVLTENYFLQIAYEIGVAGLLFFAYIAYLVIKRLYGRQDFYGQAMVSAFAGITVCGLLFHVWSNEAVAAQWWLLAGAVLANSGKIN